MAKIAVIGWGSLLWDLDDLEPHVEGDWQVAGGPLLPLEFVRVSAKRKMALAVVIDYDHGVPCASSHIQSRRGDVMETVGDLARRERAPEDQIGYLDRSSGASRSRHPSVHEGMLSWLEQTGYDAAVWTDLTRNYEEMLGHGYSLDAAIGYLKALPQPSLIEAHRYIESAPANVETPLRAALRDLDWWQEVRY